LTNILGTILSLMLIGGFLFLYVFDYYVSGSEREVMIHDIHANLFTAVFLYFECMMIGTIIAGAIVANYVPKFDKDFMIILGCGMNKDGTPTPLLRGRCDAAIDFYQKQLKATGKELTFVPSGGQGSDEIISESECMKRYLLSKGIREEQIIKEDRSTDTFENMMLSKVKIREVSDSEKIAFATSKFHVFRAGLFARRVKMRAVGVGADTKWYFWPNAAVREFVGLLTKHRLKQACILIGMIIVYVGLTLLQYSR
ncbi:MAG: YdcF family protein, partial [Erysipelotrichaceae bacterium]|nr:YdcF family protein [Erysipelotrichaceae bacterium]